MMLFYVQHYFRFAAQNTWKKFVFNLILHSDIRNPKSNLSLTQKTEKDEKINDDNYFSDNDADLEWLLYR